MPSPNGAQKSCTKPVSDKKKAAELGHKLARRRSQDFKSKIAGWDGGAAGVVQADDEIVVVVEDDEPAEPVAEILEDATEEQDAEEGEDEAKAALDTVEPTTPKMPKTPMKPADKPSTGRKTSREIDMQRKAWVRRKPKPAADVTPELKEATTPKKRVVSDGHWRRDRVKKDDQTPDKEKDKENKETTPKPIVIKRSVASVGLKTSPTVQSWVEEVEPEPVRVKKLTPRSRTAEREQPDKESTPDYESDGTKIYVKRRRKPGADENGKASGSSVTAPSSVDRPSTATDITTPDPSPTKDDTPRPKTAPKERTVSKIAEEFTARERAAKLVETRRQASKEQRRSSLDKEATPPKPRIPAVKREPPVPIPKVTGNRIAGWLSEMPEDPFAPPSEPSVISDPLPSSRPRSKPLDPVEDMLNTARRRSSGKARRSRHSPESLRSDERPREPSGSWNTIDDWVHDSSATGLRRSGARRNAQSPVKDRIPREGSISPSRPPPSGHSIEGSTLSRASDGDEPSRGGGGLKRRLTKHADLMSVLSPSQDDGNLVSRRSTRSRRVHKSSATIADLMNDITTDELRYQRELRTLVDGVIPVLLSYVISQSEAGKTSGSRKTSLHDNPALTQPIYDMGVSLERLRSSHKHIPMHDANELLRWAEGAAKLYSDYIRVWRLGFEDIVVNLAPAGDEGEHESTPDYRKADGADEGERVEVAYLLKRPLIRAKNLSKTLKAINDIKPSALADNMVAKYQDLVTEARRRSNHERARLEDEAAAAIDPTRARDPRNLAQLQGVTIDSSRNVRARDFFDMELYHSSGQQLGCKVELIRRDNHPGMHGAGDVLFCEISTNGRWLLFPPILANYVSARKGSKEGEIVVMVRGMGPSADEWREVMSLQSSDDQGEEWVEMLGSNPMPPRLNKQSSFNTLRIPSKGYDAPPSPTESIVPIGERAMPSAPRWDGSDVNSAVGTPAVPEVQYHRPKRYHGPDYSTANRMSSIAEDSNTADYQRAASHVPQAVTSDNEKRSRYRHARSRTDWSSDQEARKQKDYSVWLPSSDRDSEESADEEDRPAKRPTMHRRTSSVPSEGMPTIRKLRKAKPEERDTTEPMSPVDEPMSAPAKLHKKTPPSKTEASPPTPTHSARPTSLGIRSGALPSFTPNFLKKHRRSSSPLKHEYEPSTATESSSDSDLSDEDDDKSITSHSSVEEAVSTLGELKEFSKSGAPRPATRTSSRSSPSLDNESLRPSDSPSQGPYRSVPPSTNGSAKAVACILAWNGAGSWDTMHPEECEIVVTPGLIEAFDLSQAHAIAGQGDGAEASSPSVFGVRPLVALELTPLVPLRRGTALDISIRSPPTANSMLRRSNNIMFRSRSPEDCERLYNLINRARIDNPTWIALQNARGPVPTSNWAEVMDRRNAARADSSHSWIRSLSRKGSTYRSKGTRSASIAASQSSVGTMNSAMFALRKFSNSSRIFNIAKSTITSKEGTRSSGSDSLDSGQATPVPFDTQMGTPLGITNTKCRLYFREEASKWRDMGSARLTIMLPPRPDPSVPVDPNVLGMRKRVLITGKSRGETLLDVTLEERCFERVGRTGVAVTIWQELVGPNGELGQAAATGGVGTSQTRTYMIQMKSERDAAFTFSMVGKLRY